MFDGPNSIPTQHGPGWSARDESVRAPLLSVIIPVFDGGAHDRRSAATRA